jgi:hypothetical protein
MTLFLSSSGDCSRGHGITEGIGWSRRLEEGSWRTCRQGATGPSAGEIRRKPAAGTSRVILHSGQGFGSRCGVEGGSPGVLDGPVAAAMVPPAGGSTTMRTLEGCRKAPAVELHRQHLPD